MSYFFLNEENTKKERNKIKGYLRSLLKFCCMKLHEIWFDIDDRKSLVYCLGGPCFKFTPVFCRVVEFYKDNVIFCLFFFLM